MKYFSSHCFPIMVSGDPVSTSKRIVMLSTVRSIHHFGTILFNEITVHTLFWLCFFMKTLAKCPFYGILQWNTDGNLSSQDRGSAFFMLLQKLSIGIVPRTKRLTMSAPNNATFILDTLIVGTLQQ